jgi:N-acetylglutamate synthase-like GNAT family acetyltransferase
MQMSCIYYISLKKTSGSRPKLKAMIAEQLSQGILRTRWANHEDIEGLLHLVNGSYRGDASRLGWTTEADLLDGQRTDHPMLEALLKEKGSFIFLMEAYLPLLDRPLQENDFIIALRTLTPPDKKESRVVACAHLKQSEKGLYFGMLSVEPRLQSFGLGRYCLEHFKALAQSQGASRLWMTVIEQRYDLIAYYERRGFRKTDQLHPFPNHDPRYGISKVGDLKLIEMDQEIPPNC